MFFISITGYMGLVAYATYFSCDPMTTKLEKAKDQLLPLLVMRTLGDYPGVPGFFVAGIFSAALRYYWFDNTGSYFGRMRNWIILNCSTLSTGLNAMSAVTLEDFVKPFTTKRISYRLTSFIMRSAAVLFGIICLGLVFLVEKLGTVLQVSENISIL